MNFSRMKGRIVERRDEVTLVKRAQLALLFCGILGLPNEAEWEFAARGGSESTRYVRREEFKSGEKYLANTLPANGYGLDDMAGAVWQWCSERVVKGGPFRCNPAYPENYQPSARCGAPPDACSSRTSFRCVASGYTEHVGRVPEGENFVIK
jgi:formylglycine-generating enzyme required for sulfatase activity